jgi:hypothetical protein
MPINKLMLPEGQFSEEFIRKMMARIVFGFYRYGQSKQYAENSSYNIIETIKKRLQAYVETGNKEHLVDAANFIMIEYMYPQHKNVHFESVEEEDSNKRLGVVRNIETILKLEEHNITSDKEICFWCDSEITNKDGDRVCNEFNLAMHIQCYNEWCKSDWPEYHVRRKEKL